MATGRTLSKWAKIYAGGYDLTGYTRKVGSLPWSFDAPNIYTITDGSDNFLLGRASVGPFQLNAILDNTATSGIHTLMAANTSTWDLMVALGIRANPIQGDPVWMGKFIQKAYIAGEDSGATVATIDFQGWDGGDMTLYKKPWGTLVHASGAETGANAAVGYDDGAGGQTLLGGYMMYQIFNLNAGTATISIDDSATNLNDAAFAPCAGLTTGAIAVASTPSAGIIELGRTATVRQYIRWQLALAGGANTCTFALAFVRGNGLT